MKEDLSIDLEKTGAMFEADPPAFVCATAVSNVTGYILPVAEIFTLAKKYRAFTLMDAAQAFGFIPIHIAPAKADAIVFAGHKSLYSTFGIVGAVLDKKYDIAVRAGYHCVALVHNHLGGFESRGTVRVSIGAFTTEEDIDALLRALREMDPEKLKYISPGDVVVNC